MPELATPATLLDGVDIAPLLEPVELLPGLRLRNRFAMAPMTRMRCPEGVPTSSVRDYYARRATSLGLIITEGIYVDHESAGSSPNVPQLDGDAVLQGWRGVIQQIHDDGAKVFAQLWHLGGIRRAGSPPHPYAPVVTPSGLHPSGRRVGEPAAHSTIDDIVASFARAAQRAVQVGFDGIELHGAHGYLLDQFLWKETNQRHDAYGNDIEGRVRLSVEIVQAIRAVVPRSFPVQYRFSQWKGAHYDAQIATTPQELERILLPLSAAGVDVFHASVRRYWEPAFQGSPLTLSAWTKRITEKPVVTVGSVGVASPFLGEGEAQQATLSLRRLMELYERDDFDVVAVGRALLADPQWVAHLRDRTPQEIVEYSKESEGHYF